MDVIKGRNLILRKKIIQKKINGEKYRKKRKKIMEIFEKEGKI